MEDKKQIEDMAKDISRIQSYGIMEVGDTQAVIDSETIAMQLNLWNYRKLPKDSVVVSKEEYKRVKEENRLLKIENENAQKALHNYLQARSEIEINTRKETMEKIITIIKDYYGDISVIARITEQFGLEVKND